MGKSTAWTGYACRGEPTAEEREAIERVRREIREVEFSIVDIRTLTEILSRYNDLKATQIMEAAYTLSREERRRRLTS